MNKKKILIVDDQIEILNVFKKAFEKKGYTVHTAETSEGALEILKVENLKVMFLDLNLPGINGLDLCRKIRKDRSDAQIFAITGYASKYEFSDCHEAGFDGYFTKPVNLKLLYEITEKAFDTLSKS